MSDHGSRWTIIGEEFTRGKNSYVRARCSCGNESDVMVYYLKNGISKSCGCIRIEKFKERTIKHGRSHTPEYHAWQKMFLRCEDETNPGYKHYGGRGISICERWRVAANFLADMGKRPTSGHSLDRIDNEGNYEPGNCRWATQSQQANNTRRTVRLTFQGETMTQEEWASRVGIKSYVIAKRLKRGWSLERALTVKNKRRVMNA